MDSSLEENEEETPVVTEPTSVASEPVSSSVQSPLPQKQIESVSLVRSIGSVAILGATMLGANLSVHFCFPNCINLSFCARPQVVTYLKSCLTF